MNKLPERKSRKDFCMSSALLVSTRGTCSRKQVGCVAVKEGRVVASGYNGVPSGLAHCDHSMDQPGTPCLDAIHAEANLISFSANKGISLSGCDLYCTLSPCRSCSQLIVAAGLLRVIYYEEYRDKSGINYLTKAGVHVEKFHGC